MNRLLEDKVAIVTGATRGIGATTARAFAAAGASILLAARSGPELEALAADITAAGGTALAVPTDVTDPASVQARVERTVSTYGRLDIAFNNAGHGDQPVPLAELAVEEFDDVLAVNARGVFLALKHEIAAMRANGGGAIVNMTSTAGLRGVKVIAADVASKHAIVGLTKTAALDYAEHGIRVNAVAPGPIDSHRLEHLPEQIRAASPPPFRSDAEAAPTSSPRLPGWPPTTPRSSPEPPSRSTAARPPRAHEPPSTKDQRNDQHPRIHPKPTVARTCRG